MTRLHAQSRNAFELHQSGHSLEQIAECLNTSDDRASQLIAEYRQQLASKPKEPWWYGLTPANRIRLEEIGLHCREDIEAAYQEGAFTPGHPQYLPGFSERHIHAIKAWLNVPNCEEVTYPARVEMTFCLSSERFNELQALCRAEHAKPSELVERLISGEARRKGITQCKP